MAELNLNFHEQTERYKPTKREINQIEGVATSVEAIIQVLEVYAGDDHKDLASVCMCVCNALELLMGPIIEYLSNYAGALSTPEEEADHAS